MTGKFNTSGAQQCALRAYEIAERLNHEYVTVEHLLASLLHEESVINELDAVEVDINKIGKDLEEFLNSDMVGKAHEQWKPRQTTALVRVIDRSLAKSMFSGQRTIDPADIMLSIMEEEDCFAAFFLEDAGVDSIKLKRQLSATRSLEDEEEEDDVQENEDDGKLAKAKKLLKKYCTLLNDTAGEGKIDPLIGRTSEIEDLTLILARRQKNNVMLVGEPGTGKTAIAEGLALKIVRGEVPEILQDTSVYSLDLGAIVAGTKFRGDMEERIKQVIKALKEISQGSKAPILFIDEAHMMMGAGGGGQSGSMDVSNLLKPALARGELRCIGATTLDEYRKHFEKDRALMRRFQKLDVKEPSVADAKLILQGLAKSYEEFHDVTYEPEAIDAAVELTSRYIMDKMLPDKAIDAIDIAGARYRILHSEEGAAYTVTVTDIEEVVSKMGRVPARSVKESEADKLERLPTDLKTVVFGQDNAVETLVQAVYETRAGLREPNKPQGSYLFAGPTGVGKTEVAKQLAKTLNVELIRFDMSEYMEKHSVSKFIGSPPGYVGFGDGQAGSGLLTNAIETNPHCVLLLDEVEKAHQDIYSLFLQVMDDGRLTSGNGKTVDFRNVILIMTSNAGASDMERGAVGFGRDDRAGEDDKAIKRLFTPEFRNRLDAIVKFGKLKPESMIMIVDKFLNQLDAQAAVKNVTLSYTDAAKQWLAVKGYDPKNGARPLGRVIKDNIKKPLSPMMLFGALKNGGNAVVDCVDDKLTVTATA